MLSHNDNLICNNSGWKVEKLFSLSSALQCVVFIDGSSRPTNWLVGTLHCEWRKEKRTEIHVSLTVRYVNSRHSIDFLPMGASSLGNGTVEVENDGNRSFDGRALLCLVSLCSILLRKYKMLDRSVLRSKSFIGKLRY